MSAGEPLSVKPPRGTHDILPAESFKWQTMEAIARRVIQAAGYREIRIPVFEHTEIFKRGVGETTDIVNKEMYTFSDRSDRSLTLRPEGTAGVVRAYLNGGMTRQPPPVKLWYLGPMFRYERAQKGRQRQFHQIGIEAFGSNGPHIDAETILVACDFLTEVGVTNLEVQINSIGCKACRPRYREALKEYLEPKLKELCPDCQERFERNPLRMLDCKSEHCQEHYREAPVSVDYLCKECTPHFTGLQESLSGLGVKYTVNKRLVRGLDYYTRTVVEFVSSDSRLGAQSTVCAGGRYDNLVELFGGPPTPAVGWALGLERLHLILSEMAEPALDAFIVASNPDRALELTTVLRRQGIVCDLDYPAGGIKARPFGKQLALASKKGAKWTLIYGDDEIEAGQVTLKDMDSGNQSKLAYEDVSKFLLEKKVRTCPG